MKDKKKTLRFALVPLKIPAQSKNKVWEEKMMRKLLKFVALALVLTMVLGLAGCGTATDKSSSTDSTVAESGAASTDSDLPELRVGMECNYAPFNWTQTDDSNGAVAIDGGGYANGYDVQIAKKIAAGMNRKLVIVKLVWDGLEPALSSGTIDAIIAGMSPTDDRKTRMDFSANYYNSELVVVVKKDGAFAAAKTLKDFSGAKITAQLSTFHYTVIDQLTGVKKQTEMEDFPTMITALEAGTIDGYISEKPGAESAMVSNPDLTFVSFAEGAGFVASEGDTAIAVGLKKGSALAAEMNPIIDAITADERNTLMVDALKNQPLVAAE